MYALATTATNLVFKDAKVLRGPCPSCNTQNFTYFGDILTVPGNRGTNAVRGRLRVGHCIKCVWDWKIYNENLRQKHPDEIGKLGTAQNEWVSSKLRSFGIVLHCFLRVELNRLQARLA